VLGSRSTDTLAKLGPEPLTTGSRLKAGPLSASNEGAYLRSAPQYGASARLRILAGPHQEWFSPETLLALRNAKFRVSSQSDRIGLRLEGTELQRLKEAELPSMGMVEGAIQVPGSGQPIVLMANHGATGGYPVIAHVVAADLHLAAQLAPGGEVGFEDVSRTEALQALRDQETRLAEDIVAADAALLAARALMQLAGTHSSLQRADVTDGQRRIRIRK
jgi:allophanate hydrolase subunit 2